MYKTLDLIRAPVTKLMKGEGEEKRGGERKSGEKKRMKRRKEEK